MAKRHSLDSFAHGSRQDGIDSPLTSDGARDVPAVTGANRGILRAVSGPFVSRIRSAVAAVLILALFLAASLLEGAKKKKGSSRKGQTTAKKAAPASATASKGPAEPDWSKVQGPRMPVYQGPPAPPVLRAAGECMQYEPGVFVVLAEVGGAGRVFRLDGHTALDVKPQRGGRLRILYVDGVDGPLARKVMQGPQEVSPAATAVPQTPNPQE